METLHTLQPTTSCPASKCNRIGAASCTLERFRNSCTLVSAVTEPCGSVFRSNGFYRCSDGLVQGFGGPGFGSTQALLELGPGFLDGIKVRRVRRQIQQLRAAGFNQLADSGYLVGAEVIQDQHVAGPQRCT